MLSTRINIQQFPEGSQKYLEKIYFLERVTKLVNIWMIQVGKLIQTEKLKE